MNKIVVYTGHGFASLGGIEGQERQSSNKIDLFLKTIAYNSKLILILICFKYITEIQCEVIKSFDHHFDNYWGRRHSSQAHVFKTDFIIFLPEPEKGMKNF